MKIYTIHVKNIEEGNVGYGIKIDDKPIDCGNLSQEDSICIRGMLESVATKLYHEAFIKEYGKCPTCNVKSVFGDEPQKL